MSWIPFWLQDVQLSTSQSLVPKQGIKQPGRRSPKPGSGWLWFSLPTAVNQSKTKQNVQPSSMPKYRRWQQHPANIWAFLQWGEKSGLQICIQRVKGLQRCLKKGAEKPSVKASESYCTQPALMATRCECCGSIPVYVWIVFSPLLQWKKQTNKTQQTNACVLFAIWRILYEPQDPPKRRVAFSPNCITVPLAFLWCRPINISNWN